MKKLILLSSLLIASIVLKAQILVDFGGKESENIHKFPNWNSVFKDKYTNYATINGVSGTTISAGNSGAYNYQGVKGTILKLNSGNGVKVTWYNSSSASVTFTPKISFDDPDRITGGNKGTWYDMSSITVSAKSSANSTFEFNTSNQGQYSLVNVNINFDNKGTIICDKIELTGIPEDTEAPTKPGNFQVQAVSAYQAKLTWTAATDNIEVIGYKIYRRNKVYKEREFELIASTSNLEFTDKELSPNNTYQYKVLSYDFRGNENETEIKEVKTHKGDIEKHTLLSFNAQNGLENGFDNWTYSDKLGSDNMRGGFYDKDGELTRDFTPYYNYYNSDHMGWLRWGYADIEKNGGVKEEYLRFVITGGAYDDNGTVKYSGLEVKNKAQFDNYIKNNQAPYAARNLTTNAAFYFITGNRYNTIDEAQGTDRLSVWVYLPTHLDHEGEARPETSLEFYPFIDDGGGNHYYHRLHNVGMGGWTHFVFDAHPQHNNDGSLIPGPYKQFNVGGYDASGDAVDYFNRIARFSLTLRTQEEVKLPQSIYMDEVEFYRIDQPENDETIAGIGIGYDPESKYFDVSFNDKYLGGPGDIKYELRYSFTPITNVNFPKATLADIKQNNEGDNANFTYWNGHEGQIPRPTGYRKVWAKFKLKSDDEAQLSMGKQIYFAVKDISDRTDLCNAPEAQGEKTVCSEYRNTVYIEELDKNVRIVDLIKTIDYKILPIPGQNLLLADFSADITSGDKPLMVKFKDKSTGNPTKWAWDFGTTDITFGNNTNANSQNPQVTFNSAGTYTVKLTVTNENGNNTKTINDYITVKSSTGISDTEANTDKIKLYPNPAGDFLFIESQVKEIAHIYNSEGRQLQIMILEKGKNRIDISHLPNGLYIVKVNSYNFKFVKQ